MQRYPWRARALAGVCSMALWLLLCGCAATRVQSFVDPDYTQTQYDGFFVYGLFADLGLEAAFERALCRELLAAGHACTTMLEAAPPTREQDNISRHAASRNSGAQASILVELADMDSIARRALARHVPAFEISVIDNDDQQVAARMAITVPHSGGAPAMAEALAETVAQALRTNTLLYPR